jgi:hypothetical protein
VYWIRSSAASKSGWFLAVLVGIRNGSVPFEAGASEPSRRIGPIGTSVSSLVRAGHHIVRHSKGSCCSSLM